MKSGLSNCLWRDAGYQLKTRTKQGGRVILGPWCLLRSMNHCDDIHLIRLDVIHDPVGPLKNLTNLRTLGFGNDASGLWEITDLLRTSCQAINNTLCIFRRALSDVGMKASKVADRRVGPVDLHFGSPNEERTCSTSVVRPAWLSATPVSIAWRT